MNRFAVALVCVIIIRYPCNLVAEQSQENNSQKVIKSVTDFVSGVFGAIALKEDPTATAAQKERVRQEIKEGLQGIMTIMTRHIQFMPHLLQEGGQFFKTDEGREFIYRLRMQLDAIEEHNALTQ